MGDKGSNTPEFETAADHIKRGLEAGEKLAQSFRLPKVKVSIPVPGSDAKQGNLGKPRRTK